MYCSRAPCQTTESRPCVCASLKHACEANWVCEQLFVFVFQRGLAMNWRTRLGLYPCLRPLTAGTVSSKPPAILSAGGDEYRK